MKKTGNLASKAAGMTLGTVIVRTVPKTGKKARSLSLATVEGRDLVARGADQVCPGLVQGAGASRARRPRLSRSAASTGPLRSLSIGEISALGV